MPFATSQASRHRERIDEFLECLLNHWQLLGDPVESGGSNGAQKPTTKCGGFSLHTKSLLRRFLASDRRPHDVQAEMRGSESRIAVLEC